MHRNHKNLNDTFSFILFVALAIALTGCQTSTDTVAPTAETEVEIQTDDTPTDDTQVNDDTPTASATSETTGGEVALTPGNTTVAFVGSHVVESGPDPDARSGKFGVLSGTATVADGKLSAVAIEIETASLSTGNDKLDGHLKSPDFFDVRENPKAKFTSTAIETADNGDVTITGDFQLLKETKSISFPAKFTAEPMSLSAEFEIDRTEFGMTFGEAKIEKAVKMNVTIK